MNPARHFGPSLISNYWQSWWVVYTGPFIGAFLGTYCYTYLLAPDKEKPKPKARAV